jgi:hypothetical protein
MAQPFNGIIGLFLRLHQPGVGQQKLQPPPPSSSAYSGLSQNRRRFNKN